MLYRTGFLPGEKIYWARRNQVIWDGQQHGLDEQQTQAILMISRSMHHDGPSIPRAAT